MRALAKSGWIRFATIFLLAWISVDLGLPDLCAGDAFDDACPASCMSHHDNGAAKHPGLLHPDHCFCHARSITLSTQVLLAQPLQSSAVNPFHLSFVPAASLAQLYHPPQPSLQ